MKAYWRSGYIDFDTGWRLVSRFTPLYLRRNSPWYPLTRGSMGLHDEEKRKIFSLLGLDLGPLRRQASAIM
jgi:hypothetical protein